MESTLRPELTEKQIQRKRRILRATEEIVYAQGFYKMSLDELVGGLKVSKSTIYDFFGSKEGLIEAVVDRFGDRLENGLDEIYENQNLSVEQRLVDIAHHQGESVACLTRKFMDDLRIHAPHLLDKFEARRKQRIEKIYGPLIDQGIEQGLFDPSYDRTFLLQLYLKMSDLVGKTDILDHLSMSRIEAFDAFIKVFIKGTKNMSL